MGEGKGNGELVRGDGRGEGVRTFFGHFVGGFEGWGEEEGEMGMVRMREGDWGRREGGRMEERWWLWGGGEVIGGRMDGEEEE